MSEGRTGQEQRSSLRAILPVFLVIIIAISSSAGCIDKGVAHSIVDVIDNDTGPGYVWEFILDVNGKFIIEPSSTTSVDPQQIGTKIIENISSLDPAQTIENIRKIMNEENLTMKKYEHTFYVVEDTKTLNVELLGIFATSGGDNAPSAGLMEITIIDPEGRSERQQINQFQERQMYTFAQTPTPGEWEIEMQGFGLRSPLDIFYSGEYELSVRAEMPRDA
jgi:hypothetical protein